MTNCGQQVLLAATVVVVTQLLTSRDALHIEVACDAGVGTKSQHNVAPLFTVGADSAQPVQLLYHVMCDLVGYGGREVLVEVLGKKKGVVADDSLPAS